MGNGKGSCGSGQEDSKSVCGGSGSRGGECTLVFLVNPLLYPRSEAHPFTLSTHDTNLCVLIGRNIDLASHYLCNCHMGPGV
jgi:hypothetical protein